MPRSAESRVMEGAEAVAAVEARIIGSPVDAKPRNVRGALAQAIGRSQSGTRAAAFLNEADLPNASDLLDVATERSLPLVMHVAGRGAYATRADSRAFSLIAGNVQEAVDFALVARRVAERALVPGVVLMDASETAAAWQDVVLPDAALVRAFLGEEDDVVPSPTPAQRLLFGDTRRRVPVWYDLDRPVMLGARREGEIAALGEAGRDLYSLESVAPSLELAFAEFGTRIGRAHDFVSEYRTRDADTVLVAVGSAIETAACVVDRMRERHEGRIGVVGIRSLRPLPMVRILELLRRKRTVVILEPSGASLAADSPTTRELRAGVSRALENGRFEVEKEFPAWKERDQPRFVTVFCGTGTTLRPSDVAAAVREAQDPTRTRFHLGIDFAPQGSSYPKRQVLLDRIRRHYPDMGARGLRTEVDEPDPYGDETGVAITLIAADRDESTALARSVASMLFEVRGGPVRSRAACDSADAWHTRRIVIGGASRTPSVERPANVTLALVGPRGLPDRLPPMAHGGALLTVMTGGADPRPAVTDRTRALLAARSIDLWALPCGGVMETGCVPGAVAAVLGIPLSAAIAGRPEAEQDEIRRGFESVERVQVPDAPTDLPSVEPPDVEPPYAVRSLGHGDATYDNLARFWDEVGLLARDGEIGELSPDPLLTAGLVPALSSTFRQAKENRAAFPVFDPARCTGCGDCWTACPDGALGPLVIAPDRLLDRAIDLAKSRGRPADALRPLVSKLGALMRKAISGQDNAAAADVLVRDAFGSLVERMDLTEDRRQSLTAACDGVAEVLREIPLVRTAPFHDVPEADSPGSGEVFSLSINPQTCKGCSACITACEPEALSAAIETPEVTREAAHRWKLWELLPDTSGATMHRARRNPDVGPAAATLLSRQCLHAMAGSDPAEPGSGAKTALRLTLAAAEYALQPRQVERIEEIETLQTRLAEAIRDAFAQALPTSDLDALSEGLHSLRRRDVDLGALAARVDEACGAGSVDGTRLSQLVDTARALANLRFRLEQGLGGLPRARYGLVVAGPGAGAWAGAFPYNPFSVPTALEPVSEMGNATVGLLEGQLRASVRDLRLVRRAHHDTEQPSPVTASDPKPASWRDLGPDDRRDCAPVFLVAAADDLDPGGISEISVLLDSGLPVKIVVLSGPERADLGLLAMAHRDAFVLQSSIAFPDHLVEGAISAIHFDGPAFIHVDAPSPGAQGLAADQAMQVARDAASSRSWPLFVYDPTREGVFGTRLDLGGNPPSDADEGTASDLWRTLQELAGRVTPFSESVRQETERGVAERHAAELATNREEHERALAALRASVEAEMADRLRRRLGVLAGRRTTSTERSPS